MNNNNNNNILEQSIFSSKYLYPQNKKDLNKRLAKIHQKLKEIDQDCERPTGLDTTARKLISKTFLEHRDKEIRLLTCCCIVDILRIYVPQAPYTPKELLLFFNVVIQQLRGLSTLIPDSPSQLLNNTNMILDTKTPGKENNNEINNENNEIINPKTPSFHFSTPGIIKTPQEYYNNEQSNLEIPTFSMMYYFLLHSLATVKSSILLVELQGQGIPGAEETLQQFFECFLLSIRSNHSQEMASAMIEVLLSCLDEFENIIPLGVLDTILTSILPSQKKDNIASYHLAQALLSRSFNKMQIPISDFIQNLLNNDKTKIYQKSELNEYVYPLIYELHKISSQYLLYIFPHLSNKLNSPDLSQRSRVIQLLGRLFASTHADYINEYYNIFLKFLERFTDYESEIRLQMIEIGVLIIQKKKYTLLNNNNNEIEIISEYLPLFNSINGRLLDPDWNVRRKVVHELCDLALNDIDIVILPLNNNNNNITLLKSVGDRVMDKKSIIREEVIVGLSQIWKEHISKKFSLIYTQDNNNNENISILTKLFQLFYNSNIFQSLSWIPDLILKAYSYPDSEMKLRVSYLFDDLILFPHKGFEDETSLTRDMKREIRASSIILILSLLLNNNNINEKSNSIEALNRMMKDKEACQTSLGLYLDIRNEAKLNNNINNNDNEDEDEDEDNNKNKKRRKSRRLSKNNNNKNTIIELDDILETRLNEAIKLMLIAHPPPGSQYTSGIINEESMELMNHLSTFSILNKNEEIFHSLNKLRGHVLSASKYSTTTKTIVTSATINIDETTLLDIRENTWKNISESNHMINGIGLTKNESNNLGLYMRGFTFRCGITWCTMRSIREIVKLLENELNYINNNDINIINDNITSYDMIYMIINFLEMITNIFPLLFDGKMIENENTKSSLSKLKNIFINLDNKINNDNMNNETLNHYINLRYKILHLITLLSKHHPYEDDNENNFISLFYIKCINLCIHPSKFNSNNKYYNNDILLSKEAAQILSYSAPTSIIKQIIELILINGNILNDNILEDENDDIWDNNYNNIDLIELINNNNNNNNNDMDDENNIDQILDTFTNICQNGYYLPILLEILSVFTLEHPLIWDSIDKNGLIVDYILNNILRNKCQDFIEFLDNNKKKKTNKRRKKSNNDLYINENEYIELLIIKSIEFIVNHLTPYPLLIPNYQNNNIIEKIGSFTYLQGRAGELLDILFNIISNNGNIFNNNNLEYKYKLNKNNQENLILISSKSILTLFNKNRQIESLLSIEKWHRLAWEILIKNKNNIIRDNFINILLIMVQHEPLSMKFLSYFSLLDGTNKEKSILMYGIRKMRLFYEKEREKLIDNEKNDILISNNNNDDNNERKKRRRERKRNARLLTMQMMPEYILPYVIHLLANHPDFPKENFDNNNKNNDKKQKRGSFSGNIGWNKNKLKFFQQKLSFILDILVGSLGTDADNVAFLLHIIDTILMSSITLNDNTNIINNNNDNDITTNVLLLSCLTRYILQSKIKTQDNLSGGNFFGFGFSNNKDNKDNNNNNNKNENILFFTSGKIHLPKELFMPILNDKEKEERTQEIKEINRKLKATLTNSSTVTPTKSSGSLSSSSSGKRKSKTKKNNKDKENDENFILNISPIPNKERRRSTRAKKLPKVNYNENNNDDIEIDNEENNSDEIIISPKKNKRKLRERNNNIIYDDNNQNDNNKSGSKKRKVNNKNKQHDDDEEEEEEEEINFNNTRRRSTRGLRT